MPAHIAGFGSIEGVAQAKGEIYEQLEKNDIAVVNLDEKFSAQWLGKLGSDVITVSLDKLQANCRAKNIVFLEESTTFTLVINSEEVIVCINALGEHSVRNALMAAAMAYAAGASLQNIQQGLKIFSPVGGRMSRHTGFNSALIIDDSYNANPGSVRAAIDVLASKAGQRILVLGDLAELGDKADQLHAELGEYAQQKNLDYFFTLGVLSRHASDAFMNSKCKQHFTERELLVKKLKDLASPTTTILIKGSRSARMDLVVKALCDSGDPH
jgi:UDP-N-acetylmuramoyl-tripeptide--D-alanyl-D-alanine ligase